MNRNLFLLFFVLLAVPAVAREVGRVKYPGGRQYMYRLTLTDKQGTPCDLAHPEAFLSEKSMARRNRQHLSVDSTDLPVSPLYIAQIEAKDVEVVSKSKWNNTVLVRGKRQSVLRDLAELPFVKECRKVWTSPDSIKPAPRRTQYHKEFTRWDTLPPNPYGVTEQQTDMVGGIRLHRAGYRGKGMTIAVLDGGFMNVDRIPAMKTIRIAGTADFVTPRSENIYKEIDHGTMVLSVMAVEREEMFVGTAPEATYWLMRCEDTQTESMAEEDYWAAAVEYADSVGVDIINSSLGYHGFDNMDDNFTYRQQDGKTALISRTASMLAQKGIILVNSVGNDGMGTWKRMNFPSDARDILTVGAVTANKVNAAFSAVGPTVDGRVKPDVMALGSPTSVITGRGTISKDIGTSFSTPIVTGLVACLWQALPHKTALEIIQLVRESGSQWETPDNIFGYGIPDFWKAYLEGNKDEE